MPQGQLMQKGLPSVLDQYCIAATSWAWPSKRHLHLDLFCLLVSMELTQWLRGTTARFHGLVGLLVPRGSGDKLTG